MSRVRVQGAECRVEGLAFHAKIDDRTGNYHLFIDIDPEGPKLEASSISSQVNPEPRPQTPILMP